MADDHWMRFDPYVPVAERRYNAVRHAAKLAKQGRVLAPVVPSVRGRALTGTAPGATTSPRTLSWPIVSTGGGAIFAAGT